MTREESIQAVFDLKVGYTLELADIEILKRVARIALAAMDSEPLAWGNGCDKTVPAALRYLAENERPIGGESSFNTAHLYQLAREIELMAEAPLYRHAQPAPIVLKDHQIRELVNQLRDIAIKYHAAGQLREQIARAVRSSMLQAEPVTTVNKLGNSPVIPDGYVMVPKEPTAEMQSAGASAIRIETTAINKLWTGNAVFRAMLAAAPQDTPALNSLQNVATVSDTWIPVSERMPENKPGSYEYLVFETLNNRVNHDYWNVPDAGDEAFTPFWNHYGEYVTHWMPLPNPPKEEK